MAKYFEQIQAETKLYRHRVGLQAIFEGCSAIDGTPVPMLTSASSLPPLSLSLSQSLSQQWNVRARTKGIRSFWLPLILCVFFFFFRFSFAELTCEENGDSDGMKEINMPQYVNDKPAPRCAPGSASVTPAKVKYVQVLLLTLAVNKYYLSDTKKWHSITQQMFVGWPRAANA